MKKELIQGTDEWLKMRRNFIGGSDAPIIMQKCKWKLSDGRHKTPHVLWQEKLGLLEMNSDNDATRYGKRMEEPARVVYEHMTGILTAPEVVYHSSVQYMMASLDGLSLDKDVAVEIKNCNANDHSVARENRVPDHYYAQVQHQLACLNHDIMHYFSFHNGEGIVVEVKRDLEYLEQLYEREEKFWSCVQNLEEPELIDLDFREMGKDWEAKANRLWEMEEAIKRDTKLAKELKDELKTVSEGLNSRAGSFKLISSSRRGTIDYSLVPELTGKDLECYRKASTKAWSLQRDR